MEYRRSILRVIDVVQNSSITRRISTCNPRGVSGVTGVFGNIIHEPAAIKSCYTRVQLVYNDAINTQRKISYF